MNNFGWLKLSPFYQKRSATIPSSTYVNYNFLTSVDSSFRFFRFGSAKYFNSSGILTTASFDTPRFEYDPISLQPKGLLIEGSRTNNILRSQDYAQAVWSKSRITLTTNAIVSPEGLSTGARLQETIDASTHVLQQNRTLTAGVTTVSIYAKAGERNWFYIGVSNGSNYGAHFNLNDGSLGSTQGAIVATSTHVGNGWYRCSLTFTAVAATGQFFFRIASASNITSYTGDGVSGLYVWGAQVENGEFPSSYILTAGSAVTRAADSLTMGVSSFSTWLNQNEGTFIVEFSMLNSNITQTRKIMEIGDVNDFSDKLSLSYTSLTNINYTNIINSVTLVNINSTISDIRNVNRVAFNYKINNFQIASNGVESVIDTSGILPEINTFSIGNDVFSENDSSCMYGHIRSLEYYSPMETNIGDLTT